MSKQTDAPDPVVSFASQLRLLLVLIRNSPVNFKLFSWPYCKIQPLQENVFLVTKKFVTKSPVFRH